MNRGNIWVEIWSRDRENEVRAVRGELRGEELQVQAYTAPMQLPRLWSIEDDEIIQARLLPPPDQWLSDPSRCQELTQERRRAEWLQLWSRL